MNRLQSELQRLYPSPAAPGQPQTLVLELTRPPSWEALSAVWQGVQAELGLPAPAIAVSGTDGLQLWFSLADAVSAPQARAFLAGLRTRFLAAVEPERVRLLTGAPGAAARPTPALQAGTEDWSAFVAPDLAPVFGDTPWLDIPPGEEGQAALLRGLKSIERDAFEKALDRLAPARAEPASATVTPAPAAAPLQVGNENPRQFLQRVMNDETVALALRIEAAKALLPSGDR